MVHLQTARLKMLVRNGLVGDWRLSDGDFMRNFRLPTVEDKLEALKRRNPIAREERISFDEITHTYTVDGVVVPVSVTGLIHQFCEDFEPTAAIEQMKARDWDVKQEAYRKEDGDVMTDEEIAATWRNNGEVQRSRCQLLHYHAEQFLNGCTIEEPSSPEFQQFLEIHHALIEHFSIFRTEVSVFHCGMKLAGQIDCLCRDNEGNLVIWDWKRSKRIVTDCMRQMKPPLQHLADCNLSHYSIQLNIYRYILESEYGYRVSGMFLGIVHPLSVGPVVIEVPRLDDEIALIVEHCGASPPNPGAIAEFVV